MRRSEPILPWLAVLVLICGCAPKQPLEPSSKPAQEPPESVLPPPEPGVSAVPRPPEYPSQEPPPQHRPPNKPPENGGSGRDVQAGESGLKEVFPGIRVDIKNHRVEFDAIACEPVMPLEVVCCTPDTKEHESILTTRAQPSKVHAALLLIGLKPGTTGHWDMEDQTLKPVEPTGDPVHITLVYRDASGAEVSRIPEEMIVDSKNGARFGAAAPSRWLFAGSQFVKRNGREWYDADGAGTLIGLCTFGSETLAWGRVISPDSEVQEPEWVASKATIPPAGTPVVVRITLGP